MKNFIPVLLLLLMPALSPAAELADIDWLAGQWQGYSVMGTRSNLNTKTFVFEQAGRYLVERTTAVFPPAEPTTEYELHEDMTVYYAQGDDLLAKSFFSEGFVQSSRVTAENGGRKVVIESTEVEGGPPGMKARLTYELQEDGTMKGAFELDWSGQGYKTASTYLFKKVS